MPGCALASDQFCRISDLAIDFCEDVTPLPRAAVDAIVKRMEAAGMRAKVSSIHVNGWFGDYDKLSTTRRMLAEEFDVSLEAEAERQRWVFVGDSPNDSPMFGFFPNSVGVANVLDFAGRLQAEPAWLARAEPGRVSSSSPRRCWRRAKPSRWCHTSAGPRQRCRDEHREIE